MASGGLLARLRRRRALAAADNAVPDALRSYLAEWIAQHSGVQAWAEPASGINKDSLLLVAWDGEWTRRAVPSLDWARRFAGQHKIEIFDAGVVGYPQRMRDFDRRRAHPRRHPPADN